MNIDQPSCNTFSLGFNEETIAKIQHYCEVFDRLICLGTHMLNAIREDTVTHPDKKSIILVLFRRIIELLDSSSIQIESGCVLPCVGNLRIILETELQLDYLLEDSDLVLDKCKHFMIMELDGDLEIYENAKSEPKLINHRADILKEIQKTQNTINSPDFDDVRDLYKEKVFKKDGARKGKIVKWYSFSSNANTLRYLAHNLGKLDRYYLVYSIASNITHSSRLLSDTLYKKDGITYIRRIRDTANIDDIAKAIITISTEAIQLVSKRLLYNERFSYLQARDEFNLRYRPKYRIGSNK